MGSRLIQACEWCGRPVMASRVDARFCSKSCRQASHRARVDRCELSALDRPLRLAYADPPYPGQAHIYRGHPDYAGEVEHARLLSRLAGYDGWALSTSARALPAVLALAVAQGLEVRVGAWFRRRRPHLTARVLNAWEPVVYAGGRRVVADVADTHDASVARIPQLRTDDTLVGVTPRRRPTLPSAVIGAKPPAFCAWVFRLLGALPGDELDDLFPGSGIVGRCWLDYTGQSVARRSRDLVAAT